MSDAPSSIKSLRAFTKQLPVQGQDDLALTVELDSDNDRAFIILHVSFVENSLTEAIIKKLPGYSQDIDNELFGPNAPLSTLSDKIRIAFAMCIFGPSARSHLDELREMRNACAHSKRPISFETPELIAVAKRLPLREPGIDGGTPRYAWLRNEFSIYCIRMQATLGNHEHRNQWHGHGDLLA